jgi:hypothetical protein
VGLLHLAAAVCIGGAAVAQAPNFLSAAPAASFPAEIAANASDGLLSLVGGYKGEPMGPALPPMSTALLGIVNLRRGASTAASMGGTGTTANPYFNVANPGFDDAVAAESSPWKFIRRGYFPPHLCVGIDPAEVVVTGDRQHVLLQPHYHNGDLQVCQSEPGGLGWDPVDVQLSQKYIDAGPCEYMAVSFDTQILPTFDNSVVLENCPTATYLEVELFEFDANESQLEVHRFRIDRTHYDNINNMVEWHRVHYHVKRHSTNSLLKISFQLKATAVRENVGPGPGIYSFRFPVKVHLDNIELKSIPLNAVQLGKRGVISGCAGGGVGCINEINENINAQSKLEGLGVDYNNPPDAIADRRANCSPSYCPADLNFDGQVNAPDLAILLSAWGSGTDCQVRLANLNGDTVSLGVSLVDSRDLAILLNAWGPGLQ